jgi:hypothetical protein
LLGRLETSVTTTTRLLASRRSVEAAVRTTGVSRSRSPRFLLHHLLSLPTPNDRRLHASTTMLGHVETRQQQIQPTGIPGVGDNSPERRRASQLPQGPGASGDGSTPNPFGWQEWREATRQARPMASDDDFIPATSRAQEATISRTATHPIL